MRTMHQRHRIPAIVLALAACQPNAGQLGPSNGSDSDPSSSSGTSSEQPTGTSGSSSGTDDLPQALKTIRALTAATIVLKRGAKGCIVYDGAIPDDLEQGIVGKGFPIEIDNVLEQGVFYMAEKLYGLSFKERKDLPVYLPDVLHVVATSRRNAR